MRVLLAYDGSAGSALAVDAVRSVRWPVKTTITIVAVLEPTLFRASPWLGLYDVPPNGFDQDLEAQLRSELEATASTLATPSRTVTVSVRRGRAADAITAEAAASGADLVVMGSRGHGAVASLLLGSVSAEVVDRATVPVLVARQRGVSRVLLGADGSRSSAAVENVLREWPIFEGTEIRAVSVASVARPWAIGVDPIFDPGAIEVEAEQLERTREAGRQIARDAAEGLRAAGRTADGVVRVGDPATAIIAAARQWNADLVAVGRGEHAGLTRLLVGSVARRVLHGSQASVLIGRKPVDTRRPAGGRRVAATDIGGGSAATTSPATALGLAR